MLYEIFFRVALLGLTLGGVGFLVWCWFAFREDWKPHAIYTPSSTSGTSARKDEDQNGSLAKERHLKISA